MARAMNLGVLVDGHLLHKVDSAAPGRVNHFFLCTSITPHVTRITLCCVYLFYVPALLPNHRLMKGKDPSFLFTSPNAPAQCLAHVRHFKILQNNCKRIENGNKMEKSC